MGPVCRCLQTEWYKPGTLNPQESVWFSGVTTPSLPHGSSQPPQPAHTERDSHLIVIGHDSTPRFLREHELSSYLLVLVKSANLATFFFFLMLKNEEERCESV